MTFAQLLHLLDLTPEQWVQLFAQASRQRLTGR